MPTETFSPLKPRHDSIPQFSALKSGRIIGEMKTLPRLESPTRTQFFAVIRIITLGQVEWLANEPFRRSLLHSCLEVPRGPSTGPTWNRSKRLQCPMFLGFSSIVVQTVQKLGPDLNSREFPALCPKFPARSPKIPCSAA